LNLRDRLVEPKLPLRSKIMERNEQNHVSDNEVTFLNGGDVAELEPRITPLVVIAIIAILIGLMVPAVQVVKY
jgi:hypothetical protein